MVLLSMLQSRNIQNQATADGNRHNLPGSPYSQLQGKGYVYAEKYQENTPTTTVTRLFPEIK